MSPPAPGGNWAGHQEGCHISPAQQARLIRLLRAELDARHLTAGIVASEDNDERSTVRSLAAYSPETFACLTAIVTHTYSANDPAGLVAAARTAQKPLWVSEYGDGDPSGLHMARRIHDDITQLAARAWVYWQAVDNAGGWGLLRNRLSAGGDTAYTLNPKFHVLGQFSRFVRPGCRILAVNDSSTLAAYHPESHELVLVAVNDTRNPLEMAYDLGAFESVASTARGCRTSPTESAADLPPVTLAAKRLLATLPPRSVTTLTLSATAP